MGRRARRVMRPTVQPRYTLWAISATYALARLSRRVRGNAVKPDKPERPPAACDHLPPTIARVRTEHGYRIRCLKCGTVGPEREDPTSAWAALLKQPRGTTNG